MVKELDEFPQSDKILNFESTQLVTQLKQFLTQDLTSECDRLVREYGMLIYLRGVGRTHDSLYLFIDKH